MTTPPQVDLVVNCYERTYRNVLSPGFMNAREQSARFSFTRKVVLINNVADRAHATSLAQQRQETGEISDWFFVADELPRALANVGLNQTDLGRTAH